MFTEHLAQYLNNLITHTQLVSGRAMNLSSLALEFVLLTNASQQLLKRKIVLQMIASQECDLGGKNTGFTEITDDLHYQTSILFDF